MDAVLEHKSAARAAAFERRRLAKARIDASHACDALCGHVSAFGPNKIIAGYMPIQSEISPLPAMQNLYDQGHTMCVPVIQGKGKSLLFREWNPDAPLIEGDFGALIPRSGAFLEPSILITPLVAYDADGYRLGYGGGFYDRTLEKLRGIHRTHAVGFAYSAQLADSLPIEATDQKLNAIVTEMGVTLFD